MPSARPIGRRGGGLSSVHPAELLGVVQTAIVERTGIDPSADRPGRRRLRQPGRRAELQRHPHGVAGRRAADDHARPRRSTRSAAPASRPPTWRRRSSASGVVDVALACGVEVMSRIPIGVNSSKKLGLGVPIPKTYFGRYEMTSQFEGAERIADKWGISREDTDAFGLASQQRAARAWAEGRYDGQWVAVEARRRRRGRRADRLHAHRRARRGPPRDVAGEAGDAEAGRPRGRRAHRRQLVADLRRRRRRADDDRGPGQRARAHAAGPRRRHVPRRRRPGAHAHRPDRRHPAPARAHRPDDRRHRHVRDQRGVRLGRAGVGQGGRRRPRRRPTPTAAPSPSATRSAPPAPSS